MAKKRSCRSCEGFDDDRDRDLIVYCVTRRTWVMPSEAETCTTFSRKPYGQKAEEEEADADES